MKAPPVGKKHPSHYAALSYVAVLQNSAFYVKYLIPVKCNEMLYKFLIIILFSVLGSSPS